jgi:hypothetical protein
MGSSPTLNMLNPSVEVGVPVAMFKKGKTKQYRDTKEYRAWKHIRERCNNSSCKQYKYYGERGIKICDRWMESFINFLNDMGVAPSPKHTIERINNNYGYSPGNCKWATMIEQANNKRNNKIIHAFGEAKTLSQWCLIFNQKINTVYNRLIRGWSSERALTEFPLFFNNSKSALHYSGHSDWKKCSYCKRYSPVEELFFAKHGQVYHRKCATDYDRQRKNKIINNEKE